MADPTPYQNYQQIQEQVQDRLDDLDSYDPTGQAVIKEIARRYNISPRAKAQPPAFGQDFMNAVSQGWENMKSGLGNLRQAMTTPPAQGPDTPSMLENLFKGAVRGIGQQNQQAGLEMTSPTQPGDVGYGLLRSVLGKIPGLGPDAMDVLDRNFGRGKYQMLGPHPGAATADALGLGAQYAGPEMMKALGAPARALGRNAYKGALKFGSDISLADRPKISTMGRELGLPVVGEKSIDALGSTDDPSTFLGMAEKGVQDSIGAAKGKNVSWDTVLKPMQDYINSFDARASGAGQWRQSLQDELDKFKRQNGWRPASVDKDGNPIPERPMDPLSVADAQKLKRDTYRINSPSLYSDSTENLPAAAKQANKLHALGLKNAVDEQVPEAKQYNDFMHTGIQLQDHLIDVQKASPTFLQNWGKWVLGAGGAAVGIANFKYTAGHPMASYSVLAGVIATQALRDPQVASRLGLALSHAGSSPLSMTLGMAPAAGRLGNLLPTQPVGQSPLQPTPGQ